MGDDKLKVLRNFNLNIMFVPQRATLIKKLWDGFNELYEDIHNPNITGTIFHEKARKWLELFLTRSQGSVNSVGFIRGLYRPTDITPYIHVLVYHVPEFIDKHRDIGGGKEEIPAIVEIMEHENRCDFFYVNDVASYFEKELKYIGVKHSKYTAMIVSYLLIAIIRKSEQNKYEGYNSVKTVVRDLDRDDNREQTHVNINCKRVKIGISLYEFGVVISVACIMDIGVRMFIVACVEDRR
ncbi:hypothetical protein C2G38_2040841 [Gigaspora rosea]|uniref:Uncharacterized protein n=1 Tax=Gigaspora rosea TaxID=44941 RepID=A0A397UU06_9GLOM|nr:hypothetical protein C2G38_2040841 [Gigaspora rosea]